jgi:enoyl-CoA hydratase
MSGSHASMVERDGILHVTFTRPEKYNAISIEMWETLVEATQMLRDRDDLRVLLLTSTGKYFSAGIDLNGELAPDPDLGPSNFRRWYRQGRGSLHPIGDEWEVIEKPVVVGFQGAVLGGALELSLCADFRLATPDARLGLPEIKLGGIPGSGGTSRLTRLAGPHWARWLVLANRQVDAEHARTIGLVHEVLPAAGFEDACLAFCRDMAEMPREAFAIGKLAIELAADLDRGQARNVERLAVSGIVQGAELREMMGAMQKRLSAKGKDRDHD